MVEDGLSHTYAFRGDLHELVGLDVFEAFLKAHDHLGYDACFLVTAAGPDVGELLGLCDIDDKVVVVNVLADDLSCIHLLARV